jgi:hypothetical protein
MFTNISVAGYGGAAWGAVEADSGDDNNTLGSKDEEMLRPF